MKRHLIPAHPNFYFLICSGHSCSKDPIVAWHVGKEQIVPVTPDRLNARVADELENQWEWYAVMGPDGVIRPLQDSDAPRVFADVREFMSWCQKEERKKRAEEDRKLSSSYGNDDEESETLVRKIPRRIPSVV